MSQSALSTLIGEYNKQARTFNITVLAVSAILKKLVIANFPESGIEKEIVAYVKLELEMRYEALLADLVAVVDIITAEEYSYKLQLALLRVSTDLENKPEVDEAELVVYETGMEVSKQVDALVKRTNYLDMIESVRNECFARANRKVADVTSFLEAHLETKLHLEVLIV